MAGRRIIKYLEGSGRGPNEELSGHLAQGTGWNRADLMIAGDHSEIRSQHLPNTNQELFLYTGI
jgi:hypothetical protein